MYSCTMWDYRKKRRSTVNIQSKEASHEKRRSSFFLRAGSFVGLPIGGVYKNSDTSVTNPLLPGGKRSTQGLASVLPEEDTIGHGGSTINTRNNSMYLTPEEAPNGMFIERESVVLAREEMERQAEEALAREKEAREKQEREMKKMEKEKQLSQLNKMNSSSEIQMNQCHNASGENQIDSSDQQVNVGAVVSSIGIVGGTNSSSTESGDIENLNASNTKLSLNRKSTHSQTGQLSQQSHHSSQGQHSHNSAGSTDNKSARSEENSDIDSDEDEDEEMDTFPTIGAMNSTESQGNGNGTNPNSPVSKLMTAPAGFTRKRSLSISIFPSAASTALTTRHPRGHEKLLLNTPKSGLSGRRMSFSGHGPPRHSTFVDLGAVVEFSRFSFDQFEIRDTETANVNPASTQVYGKIPTNLSIYWRHGHSDLLYYGKKFCSALAVYNWWAVTFYIAFFHILIGDDTNIIPSDHPSIDHRTHWDNLHAVFYLDIAFEATFIFFEILTPLRSSIIHLSSGREYVELRDIKGILFRTKEWWFNIISVFGSLMWISAATGVRSPWS